jgi:hypothetical protein
MLICTVLGLVAIHSSTQRLSGSNMCHMRIVLTQWVRTILCPDIACSPQRCSNTWVLFTRNRPMLPWLHSQGRDLHTGSIASTIQQQQPVALRGPHPGSCEEGSSSRLAQFHLRQALKMNPPNKRQGEFCAGQQVACCGSELMLFCVSRAFPRCRVHFFCLSPEPISCTRTPSLSSNTVSSPTLHP